MKRFPLASDRVRLEVTEVGGMLSGVTFTIGDRRFTPMHEAPWLAEYADAPDREEDGVPPMLRVLQGDFLAAPFSDNDLLAEEDRPHGRPANGRWRPVADRPVGGSAATPSHLELELDGRVSGARVRKTVELRPGHAVVYQRDVFEGGEGRMPLGHHAMLRARHPLRLSFAPWRWAGTPPQAVEVPPNGRSALRYPQRLRDLQLAELAGGGTTDLTRYPQLDGYEDLWMLSAAEDMELGWTAAVCAAQGWAWFALKDPKVLPSTLLWLSNGGRDYAPFSGRHRGVIGLEEVCSYFHLGHRASLEANELTHLGVPTTLELEPERPLTVTYLFGLAAVPSGFDAVHALRVGDAGVTLVGAGGVEVEAACDPSFLFRTPTP